MNKILNSYTFKTILIIFVGIPILFIGIDYGYWFLNTDPLWPIKSTPIWSQKNSKYSRIPVLSVQFSPDGRILAYSSTNDEIYFVNTFTGDYISETGRSDNQGIASIAFSTNKHMFAYGGYNQNVYVEDANTGNFIYRWKISGAVHSVVFSPDSKQLASGSSAFVGNSGELHTGGAIMVYDLQTGKLLWKNAIDDIVYSVAFSQDGGLIATGDQGGFVKLWDARSGSLIVSLKKQFQQIHAVAFSPDGKYLVGAGGYVNIWDVKNHRLKRTISEQDGEVNSVAFLSKSHLMALATNRGDISVWNIVNGQKIQAFREQEDSINTIACSSDGKKLASGGSNGYVKIWNLNIVK